MSHLAPAQIQFREFMRKLTGSPGTLYPAFHAYCWRIHGVLVTLWLGNSRVRVYHYPNDGKDDTSGDHYHPRLRCANRQRGGAVCWPCDSERCREHLSNLYFRYA